MIIGKIRLAIHEWYLIIEQWLVWGLILITPSNLFQKFLVNSAFVDGLLVDYLIPKIYLIDLVIGLLLLVWAGEKISSLQFCQFWRNVARPKIFNLHWWLVQLKTISWSEFIWLNLSLWLFLTQIHWSTLAANWWLIHLALIGLLVAFLSSHLELIKHPKTACCFLISLIYLALLASWQFWRQQPLVGYWFLGEPSLDQFGNLARGWFINQEKILSYGITAHPNILAGWAVGSFGCWWTLTISQRSTLNKSGWPKLTWLASSAVISILFFTQSLAASLSWLSWWLLIDWPTRKLQSANHYWRKLSYFFDHYRQRFQPQFRRWLPAILLGCFLILPIGMELSASLTESPRFNANLANLSANSLSWQRRQQLNQAGWQLWQKRPLTGVGLNQFTRYLDTVTDRPEIIRFHQPAHHVGVLWMTETGILGLAWLGLTIWLLLKKGFIISTHGHDWPAHHATISATKKVLAALVFLLPMASLDHYLLTQPAGQLSLGWLVVCTINFIRVKTRRQ